MPRFSPPAALRLGVVLTAVLTASACASATGGPAGAGGAGGATNGSSALPASFCSKQTPDPTGTAPLTPDPNIKADLTFWGWYNLVPKNVMDDFHKIYPNINIKFVDFSTADTHTKLATALAGGAGAPDLSMVQDRDAPRFWDLPLLDLTDCLTPYKSDFPAFKWDKIARPNGQLQAAPWEADAAVMVYRRDLFKKYGIDPGGIKTWDDYVAAGKALNTASGGKTKMVMSLPVSNDNGIAGHITSDFNMMLNQQGGSYFAKDGKVTVNAPEGVTALKMLAKFRKEGITLNDVSSGQAEKAAFEGDQVATILQQASVSFALKSTLKDMSGKWGAMELPAFTDGGTRGAIRGGTSIAITGQSKSPEAAWKFLQFWLLRVDSRWKNYEVGGLVENLFLPAAKDPRFQAGDPYFGGDPYLKIVAKSAQEAPLFYENLKTNQLEGAFKQRLRPFLSDGGDAKGMLDSVASDTEKAQ
ncbi:MAG: extracellular solute-binding protein [Terracoccus sp.]